MLQELRDLPMFVSNDVLLIGVFCWDAFIVKPSF